MRCYTRQKFGHTSLRCIDKGKDKFTCGKCAGDHDSAKCTATVFKCANCGGPHQSGYAECSILKKETEILAHMKEHAISYGEAKKKVEGLTVRPNTSYASAVANTTAATRSINHELAAKDKEIAELKSLVADLRKEIKSLTKQVKVIAESTQRKQRKEDDTESQSRSHILPQVTPARIPSGHQAGSNRSASAGRLPRREEQEMEATVSKNSRGRSPENTVEEKISSSFKKHKVGKGTPTPHKT